jgi:hypothetical protein
VCIGSKFEQQFGHFEVASQNSHVQRAHLASPQVDNLGAAREEFARDLDIAALNGLVQLGGGNAVYPSLKFGPTFEAIRSRQNELRVVQREGFRRGGSVVGRDLGDGLR